MKNLDLNNYGVQEVAAVEMRETDGGNEAVYRYKWLREGIVDLCEFIGEIGEAIYQNGYDDAVNNG